MDEKPANRCFAGFFIAFNVIPSWLLIGYKRACQLGVKPGRMGAIASKDFSAESLSVALGVILFSGYTGLAYV